MSTNPLEALFAAAYARTLAPRTPPPPAAARPLTRAPRRGGAYRVLRTTHKARPGTKRARQLEIVLAHTDIRAARLAGAEQVDINLALDWRLIEMVQS